MRYGVRFHVNMERSRFPRRNRVDYKALNVLSTVDLEVHLKGRRKFKSGSKVYFVERLISRRRLKNEVCVLTLLCSCSYILLRCILPELFEILERIAVLYKKEEIQ